MHTLFCLKILKERAHSEDLGVDGWITLEWLLRKYGGKVWTRWTWLRTGISGGSLWTR